VAHNGGIQYAEVTGAAYDAACIRRGIPPMIA